jgi:hypothetical protein
MSQFIKAIVKEMNDHIVNKHPALVPSSDTPKGEKVMDYVWAMCLKRDINNQKVLKYKVLNYSHSRNPPCAPARTHG